MLHFAYGRLALARRAWYDRRPSRRRRLARPVISIGNLSVGGTGKTPLVAALASWLVAQGERPAILSRGYARKVGSAAPTLVSDGTAIRAAVDASGDEPLMLARAVPAAIVVVCADRYQAGRAAEQAGATVHLLDDGFQHLPLARDLDVVVTPAGELERAFVLPKGRLREPVSVLRRADVLVVVGASDEEAQAEASRVGVALGVGARRRAGAPVPLQDPAPSAGADVVAVSAIGRPAQFTAVLRDAGWRVGHELAFRDHHWFSAADVREIARQVVRVGAAGVVTTDKDAVRLEPLRPLPFGVARVPLVLDLPSWPTLTARVSAAMAGRRQAPPGMEARP